MTTASNAIQAQSTSRQGVMIWTLATLFYFFDNLLNVSPSAMKPELSAAFALSAAELGILSSCFLWPYSFMQIPAGLLMDTVGPRRLLTLASICCATGAGLFASAESLWAACLARIFIGIGASFAVVGCSKIASVWFSPRRFALFTGMMVAVGMLGAAFGLATASAIIREFGWRESMFAAMGVALVLSGLLYTIVRDKPPTAATPTAARPSISVMTALKEVLHCAQAWWLAIYAGLMFVPTLAFGGLWGTPYLVEAHGFSRDMAGQLSSLVFVGWVFGGPIYGWISDALGRRNPPMYFANLTTLTVCLCLIYVPNLSVSTIAILMFLLGFCSSGFIVAYAVTREANRPQVSGTAIGFINMLNNFGVAFFQWFIGQLLDWLSGDAVASSAGKVFTLGDYQRALMCLPICLAVAFLVLLPIKETYCRPKQQP